MRKIGPVALEAAESILNYVTTRFPAGHNTPPHPVDAAWFADAIQKAIDGDDADHARRLTAAARKIVAWYEDANTLLPLAGGVPQPIEACTDPAVMLASCHLKRYAG